MYQLQTLVPQQARVYESLPCEDYQAHQEHHLLQLMEFPKCFTKKRKFSKAQGKAQAPCCPSEAKTRASLSCKRKRKSSL